MGVFGCAARRISTNRARRGTTHSSFIFGSGSSTYTAGSSSASSWATSRSEEHTSVLPVGLCRAQDLHKPCKTRHHPFLFHIRERVEHIHRGVQFGEQLGHLWLAPGVARESQVDLRPVDRKRKRLNS